MSRENIDLVRRAFADWNDGGVEAMLDRYFSPDVVWRPVPEGVDPTVYRGAEATASFLGEVADAFGAFTASVLETTERDDLVLAEIRVTGTATGSGVPVDVRLFHVLRIQGGRIAEVRQFLDREEAYDALSDRPGAGAPGGPPSSPRPPRTRRA